MDALHSPAARHTTRRLLMGALAAALLAFCVWIYSSTLESAGPASAALDGADTRAAPVVAALPVAPATDNSARASIHAAAPLEAKSEATSADSTAPNELRGRVVDASDRPVAGAHVELRRGDVRDFSVLDLELSRVSERIAEATSDAAGGFHFELERGIPVDVQVEAAEFCPTLIANRHAGEFVLVRMSVGFRVFGRVTRARDGAPLAEAQVRVFHLGGPSSLEQKTRTAGNGSFELRFSFHDDAELEVVPQIEQCSDWLEVRLDAAGQAEVNVLVQDGFVVQGKVRAAGSGVPIPGATVGEGWVFRRTAVSDAQGEYHLSGFGDPGVSDLFAKARGFGTAQRQDLPGAVDGVLHVDFELVAARSAHGRVVDASGAPLRDVLAAAIAAENGAQGQRSDWISSRTDASGRFTIEDLSSDLRHVLLLAKHGSATRLYDFPEAELSTTDLDLGTFVLGAPALIAGVVEDESGHGLADTEVFLTGYNSDRFQLLKQKGAPQPSLRDWYSDTRSSNSDAAGHFSFGDLAAGKYSVHARRGGQPLSESVGVSLAESERKEHVRILLPTGLRLFGRVVDPEGQPVAGAYVRASGVQSREGAPAPTQHGGAQSDAQGKFEILGLGAGEYAISARASSSSEPDSDTPLLPVKLEHVPADSTELQIVLARGATIRGSLHDASGAAVFGYEIVNQGENGAGLSATTDANGEFCLAVAGGSSCELEVHAPRNDPNWQAARLVEHAVPAGMRGLKLTLP